MTLRRLLFLGTAGLIACGNSSANVSSKTSGARDGTPGAIEGDVYLLMQNGDTKRATANRVFLVRDDDALERAIGAPCDSIQDARHAYEQANAEYEDQVARERPAAIAAANRASAKLRADSMAFYRSLQARAQHRLAELQGRPSLDMSAMFAEQDSLGLANSRIDAMSRGDPVVTPKLPGRPKELDDLKTRVAVAAVLARSRVHAAILSAVVDTSGTGVNAHYSFSAVPAGRYVLFAEWTLGSSSYAWWKSVTLHAGENIRLDLDNSSEVRAALYCER